MAGKVGPGRGSKPGERRGGRPKGTLNKSTVMAKQVAEVLAERNLNPIETLAELCGKHYPSQIRLRAASELAEYVYPKRRAVEVTGADGGPVDVRDVTSPIDRIRSAVAQLAARGGAPHDLVGVEREGSLAAAIRLEILGQTEPGRA